MCWREDASDDPSPEWRRQFLQYAHAGGIFPGGTIAIESVALVFEIERPALAIACEKIDQWIAHANGEPSPEPSVQSPTPDVRTILVVDDQPDIGPMVEDILAPTGYIVLHTTDPMEAIRWARQRLGYIDLLLVDVVMPLMGGLTLARRILELRPKMKVILMSGYEVSSVKATGWPFLEKPFGVETLTRTVASTLSGGRPGVAGTLE